jgi:ribonuclease R
VLDDPFVDVLLRFEALGPDSYEPGDDALSVVGRRSGDRLALGDRITIVIEDVALLRRTIYGRRVPPAHVLAAAEDSAVSDQLQLEARRNKPSRSRYAKAGPVETAARAARPGRGKTKRGADPGRRQATGRTEADRGRKSNETGGRGGGRGPRPAGNSRRGR